MNKEKILEVLEIKNKLKNDDFLVNYDVNSLLLIAYLKEVSEKLDDLRGCVINVENSVDSLTPHITGRY